MAKKTPPSKGKKCVTLSRRTAMKWLDYDTLLQPYQNADRKDLDQVRKLLREAKRRPGLPRERGPTDYFQGIPLSVILIITKLLNELFSSPYSVTFVNGLDIRVQFVWAYELWSGLILVDQTPYTNPGESAEIKYAHVRARLASFRLCWFAKRPLQQWLNC